LRDLTPGPVRDHLLGMAVPIAGGMQMQPLYYLVDLYFVGRLAMQRSRAAVGNTLPALASSAGRLLTFIVPEVRAGRLASLTHRARGTCRWRAWRCRP
jgi:hypothetical protein